MSYKYLNLSESKNMKKLVLNVPKNLLKLTKNCCTYPESHKVLTMQT